VRKGWIANGIGYIPLTRGLVAIVDMAMVSVLEQWNWCAARDARSGEYYAKRITSRTLGARRHVHMARVVLGMDLFDTNIFPDHINRNKLNNRRENLRIATQAENLRNRKVQSNNKSGFKGVYYNHRLDRYDAKIKINGRFKYLGRRRTGLEAHALYCEAARKLHGEFYCAG